MLHHTVDTVGVERYPVSSDHPNKEGMKRSPVFLQHLIDEVHRCLFLLHITHMYLIDTLLLVSFRSIFTSPSFVPNLRLSPLHSRAGML